VVKLYKFWKFYHSPTRQIVFLDLTKQYLKPGYTPWIWVPTHQNPLCGHFLNKFFIPVLNGLGPSAKSKAPTLIKREHQLFISIFYKSAKILWLINYGKLLEKYYYCNIIIILYWWNITNRIILLLFNDGKLQTEYY
jgi:hypothetical protein